MKNILYENIISNIAKIVKKTINEAVIDANYMEGMNKKTGKLLNQSHRPPKYVTNLKSYLKNIGIYASINDSSIKGTDNISQQGIVNQKGKNYKESSVYETITLHNEKQKNIPQLIKGIFNVYVIETRSKKSDNSTFITDKLDNFGKTIWENDNVIYCAAVFQDIDKYTYYFVKKSVLYEEYKRLRNATEDEFGIEYVYDKGVLMCIKDNVTHNSAKIWADAVHSSGCSYYRKWLKENADLTLQTENIKYQY